MYEPQATRPFIRTGSFKGLAVAKPPRAPSSYLANYYPLPSTPLSFNLKNCLSTDIRTTSGWIVLSGSRHARWTKRPRDAISIDSVSRNTVSRGDFTFRTCCKTVLPNPITTEANTHTTAFHQASTSRNPCRCARTEELEVKQCT